MKLFFQDILVKMRKGWQHAGFQKYLKNTTWLMFSKISSVVISLFVSIYAARSFGPSDFGTLTFVVAFVSIVGSFTLLIDQILLKMLNNEPARASEILGSAFLIKLINSMVVVVISGIAAFFLESNDFVVRLIFIFSFFFLFQMFSNVIDLYFNANADVKRLSIIGTICFGISALIQALILYMGLGLTFFVFSYLLNHLILSVSYLVLYKKTVGAFSWRVDFSIVRYLAYKSWPFTVSAIATNVYMKIDQLFIKVLLGPEQLGFYVVAVRFSEVWFFISSVICIALLPAILNAEKTSRALFLTRMKRMYFFLFYSSVLISISVFLITPFLVRILYGQEFLQSIAILRVYIWSITGFFLMTGFQQFLLAENKFKTILSLNVTGMILSLFFNSLLIPRFGVLGAAYANIISYSLPVIIILFSANGLRDHRISMFHAIFKPTKI